MLILGLNRIISQSNSDIIESKEQNSTSFESRSIPTDNIFFHNNRIKFGWNCIWCMRCIYDCPNRAISPHVLKFCVVEGGYNIHSIIKNSKIKGRFITKNTKGYFRHFYDYIYNRNG